MLQTKVIDPFLTCVKSHLNSFSLGNDWIYFLLQQDLLSTWKKMIFKNIDGANVLQRKKKTQIFKIPT